MVTKSVPAYTVVGGNSARVIRQRFIDEVIAQLEQIAWWHWDAAKISQYLPHIVAADIHALQGSAG